MKKIIFILILVLSAGVSVSAQNKGMNPERAEKVFNAKAKMMQNRLQLTSEQIVKFAPLYKNYQDAVHAVKHPARVPNDANLTIAQAKESVNAMIDYKVNILEVQKSFIPKFAEVLTPQQLRRFLHVENEIQMSIMKEHMKRWKNKGQRGAMQGCNRGDQTPSPAA